MWLIIKQSHSSGSGTAGEGHIAPLGGGGTRLSKDRLAAGAGLTSVSHLGGALRASRLLELHPGPHRYPRKAPRPAFVRPGWPRSPAFVRPAFVRPGWTWREDRRALHKLRVYVGSADPRAGAAQLLGRVVHGRGDRLS